MALDKTGLGSFEVSSLAFGYRALQMASELAEVDIVEASPLAAERFLLLAQGPVATLRSLAVDLARTCETLQMDCLVDQEVIENPHPKLLPSFYSLEQVQVRKSLLVVETETVSGLIAAAHLVLSSYSLEAIEPKGTRGLQGKGLGFFTGEEDHIITAAEAIRTKLKQSVRNGIVEVIESIGPKFKDFFALGPANS